MIGFPDGISYGFQPLGKQIEGSPLTRTRRRKTREAFFQPPGFRLPWFQMRQKRCQHRR